MDYRGLTEEQKKGIAEIQAEKFELENLLIAILRKYHNDETTLDARDINKAQDSNAKIVKTRDKGETKNFIKIEGDEQGQRDIGPIRELAKECIDTAVNDVKKGVSTDKNPLIANKDAALAWFKERGTKAFGYGWCLKYSGYNPTVVRDKLDAILK